MQMTYYPLDLFKILADNSLRFSDSEVLCLFRQMTTAVAYLHDNYILHRDLKPANFLVDLDGRCILTDFGLARSMPPPDKELTRNVVTRYYRAPELLFGSRFYSEKVDVWSLGCILAEMFLREPLFKGSSEIEQLSRIFGIRGTPNKKNWPDAEFIPLFAEFEEVKKVHPIQELIKCDSEDIANCIERMLALDPNRRLTANEILTDPMFHNLDDSKVRNSLSDKLKAVSQKAQR